jgi:hypothetical protein
MKKSVLLITLTMMLNSLFAQLQMNWCNNKYHNDHGYHFDFITKPDSSVYYFQIDTTQLNNVWQTGSVDKPYFSSGVPGSRALVTDTLHSYPINNTSSFTFSIVNCPGIAPGGAYTEMVIEFSYSINTDSLNDGGTIEVSHNNGLTWTNIIYDTGNLISLGNFYPPNVLIKSLGKPGFTGTYKNGIAAMIYKPRYPPNIDTITFRFTFGSDSIQTNKDGWMITNFYTNPEYEGIDEKNKSDLITIYPNPAKSEIYIKINCPIREKSTLELENQLGQIIKDMSVTKERLSINNLLPGIYFVKYHDGNYFCVKKIIVTN